MKQNGTCQCYIIIYIIYFWITITVSFLCKQHFKVKKKKQMGNYILLDNLKR